MSSALAESFNRVCSLRADAVAVSNLTGGGFLTFAELGEEYAALRRAFAELGVPRGSCVVSLVGNHPVFFPLIVACMDAGVTLLPLGEATDAEAMRAVRHAGAVAIVTDRALRITAEHKRTLRDDVRLLRLPDPVDAPQHGCSVVLKLTSGSTDLPKAVVASESHLINDGRHIIEAMGIGADDVNLGYIPLSHSYALGNLVMPLLLQGTAIALRRSFQPSQLSRDLRDGGATILAGVPFMFDHMKAAGWSDPLPHRLRLLITAGARIDPDTVVWFHTRLGRKLHSFYGSSETGGITYDDSNDLTDPLHVGRPLPETEVTIRAASGERGEGRVFVRGTAVATRYAGTSDVNAVAKFCEDGFLTGDLGSFDARGWLVLSGRVSSLVNVAGRKVDPWEVERTLREVPGVADARVLGMSCDVRGQQVVAFVVRTDAALTPIALRQRCAARLSPYKIPRQFVFLDRFPVDARGKIDRRELQALVSDMSEL